MTREQMIDEAVRAALAGWRVDYAPWFRGKFMGEDFIVPQVSFRQAICGEFKRISSNADHASRDDVCVRFHVEHKRRLLTT